MLKIISVVYGSTKLKNGGKFPYIMYNIIILYNIQRKVNKRIKIFVGNWGTYNGTNTKNLITNEIVIRITETAKSDIVIKNTINSGLAGAF